MVKLIREALGSEFTPTYLGTQSTSRSEIIEKHTTLTSKILLGLWRIIFIKINKYFFKGAEDNDIISIWDATYVYIEKSSNYQFQRSTYSQHKYRNLLKFMMLVATDGYIIDAIGPYLANGKNNDANITIDMFEKSTEIQNWFETNDIFVVDRGFRDCSSYLKKNGYKISTPAFLGNKKQHSTKEANESRLVTMIRWVVESANGRIKRYLLIH